MERIRLKKSSRVRLLGPTEKEQRKRQRLGLKHDRPIAADPAFSRCLAGIVKAAHARRAHTSQMIEILNWHERMDQQRHHRR